MRASILVITGIITIGIGFIAFAGEGEKQPRKKRSDIDAYQVGQYTLHMPLFYVVGASGSESALLQSYYPGGAPALRSWEDHKKMGIKYKRISVLITDISRYKIFTPEKKLIRRIKERNATRVVENQYGLTYRTQPEGEKNEDEDLWVESDNREDLSFIECAKDEVRKVPHCSHHFHDERFTYKLSYDKRLLPEWQLIRSNVLDLIESFNSKETSKEYFGDQFLNTFHEQMKGLI